MEQPTLDNLTRRLERLERDNRRMQILGVILLTGLTAAALMGAVPAGGRTVEAQHFLVKDGAGTVLAEFGLRPDGLPKLELQDKNGRPRAVLASQLDGSGALAVHGSDGKSFAVSTMGGGALGLTLLDKDAHLRAELTVQQDDMPALSLYDKSLQPLWHAP